MGLCRKPLQNKDLRHQVYVLADDGVKKDHFLDLKSRPHALDSSLARYLLRLVTHSLHLITNVYLVGTCPLRVLTKIDLRAHSLQLTFCPRAISP